MRFGGIRAPQGHQTKQMAPSNRVGLEVTNRPNGAGIFHRERGGLRGGGNPPLPRHPAAIARIRLRFHRTASFAGGIVEKLQNLPFRANTKGMHGGALDKIIAELKAAPTVNCSICFLCPRVCCEAGGPHRPEARSAQKAQVVNQ